MEVGRRTLAYLALEQGFSNFFGSRHPYKLFLHPRHPYTVYYMPISLPATLYGIFYLAYTREITILVGTNLK